MFFLVKCASFRSLVTEEFSSSGDSKTEDDPEKRLPKDKDGKDRDRDREEGELFTAHVISICQYQDFFNIDKIHFKNMLYVKIFIGQSSVHFLNAGCPARYVVIVVYIYTLNQAQSTNK
jgi:hypothetical protein